MKLSKATLKYERSITVESTRRLYSYTLASLLDHLGNIPTGTITTDMLRGWKISFEKSRSQSTAVEYKSGIQTKFTNNIFLETVSVDTFEKPGWVYTCKADFILYACLLNHKILVFRPADLRARIGEIKRKFQETHTSRNQNAGYNTHGVLVPLEWACLHLAEKVIEI